jgi:hypothetical protein
MTCPADIADVLLEILYFGLLRARAASWEGDARRGEIETDHLHNLPSIIRDFKPANLEYYWNVERGLFLERSRPGETAVFEPLWDRLRMLIESRHQPAA